MRQEFRTLDKFLVECHAGLGTLYVVLQIRVIANNRAAPILCLIMQLPPLTLLFFYYFFF